MCEIQECLSYVIDARDQIVSVGGGWDHFATLNGAPRDLFSDRILSRSFWDFISGDAVEHVYRVMLGKVRLGQHLEFLFRCDSPQLRRFLKLRMTPAGGGAVEFITTTIRTEDRVPVGAAFSTNPTPTGELVVACSWCNKLQTGTDDWEEAEDAVRTLKLFDGEKNSALSHGMCNTCYTSLMSAVDRPTSRFRS
jgi:hypothetical protein